MTSHAVVLLTLTIVHGSRLQIRSCHKIITRTISCNYVCMSITEPM